MLIVGNFPGNSADCYAEFTNTGKWYDVMEGTFIDAISTNGTINIPAHSFKLLVNFDPGYYLAHSSDASKDLSTHQVIKLRSGGWDVTHVSTNNRSIKKVRKEARGNKLKQKLAEHVQRDN